MTSERTDVHVSGDRPLFWVSTRGARLALIALHVAAALAVLVELLLPIGGHGHGAERVDWLNFPASYSVYGFVGCVILVLLGRGLRRLVMRGESYYESEAR